MWIAIDIHERNTVVIQNIRWTAEITVGFYFGPIISVLELKTAIRKS